MATNFGVQLKKPEGSQTGSKAPGTATQRPYGVRRDFQSKPMSDIKAMFEKGSEGSSKTPTEFGTDFSKKTSNITKQNQKTVTTTGTTGKFSAIKTKSNVTPSNQKREAFNKADKLSIEDMAAFDILKHEIETKGVDHLDDDLVPNVAVAKVFDGGQALKSSIDKKTVTKSSSIGGGNDVSKTEAASVLSFGLTKLRTRPGSFNSDEKGSQSADNKDLVGNQGAKIVDSDLGLKTKVSNTSAIKHNVVGDSKYVPGVPRGWKSTIDDKNGRGSPTLETKIKSDVTETKLEHRAVVRPISPVTRKNSSSESSTGNMSPRGYKPLYTEQNRSNTSSPISLSNDSIGSTSTKSEIAGKVKTTREQNVYKASDSKGGKHEELESIKSHLKPIGDIKSENKIKTESSLLSHTKDSLLKSRNKAIVDGAASPRGRISSTSSNESSSTTTSSSLKNENHADISKSDKVAPQERKKVPMSSFEKEQNIRNKFNELSGLKADRLELRKREFAVSRKMSAEKFQDLKKGFEMGKGSTDSNVELRKKIGVIPAKKILEKRDSYENPDAFGKKEVKKEIASPISRKKLLERRESFEHPERYRKKSGSVDIVTGTEKGRVLQTIKSLNQLDESAKSKAFKRRSRSLPSSGIEDDVDSSGYYEDVEHEHGPYYHDILGVRYGDDISNEGDISSEADQLYEEIPALKGGRETKFTNKRATAFKKKKKIVEESSIDSQAGDDADVDSDSYSSDNSGIYEDVSGHGDHVFQVGESDSTDLEVPNAPALPAGRTPQKKKKKKEGRTSKAIYARFKQAIKGKEGKTSESTEGALKALAGPGLVGAPQTGGVLDKLKKNLRKTKSSDSSLVSLENRGLSREDIPICDSDGSDEGLDLMEMMASPKSQSLERSDEGMNGTPPPVPPPPNPPPLPPRTSAIHRASSSSDQLRLSANIDSKDGVSPRRLSSSNDLRNGGTSPRDSGKGSDPPLPPRNRISQNLDLNLVVPVAPGGADKRKSGWPPTKDSYLHGQKIPAHQDMPYMDESPDKTSDLPPLLPQKRGSRSSRSSQSSTQSDDEKPPPLPNRPAPKQPLTGKDSYVCVDPPDEPTPDLDYSLADEIRRELEKRPVSSGYIQAHDLSTVPEPRSIIPPFEDVLKFKSQYEEDGLYIDLFSGDLVRQSELRQSKINSGDYLQSYNFIQSDDQVYGTLGERYHSKLESESLYQFYNKDKISRASKRKAIYAGFDESDEEEYDSHGDKVYEDLSDFSSQSSPADEAADKAQKKLSTLEMFGKKGTVLRALWAEMPEVKKSGVLDNISAHERKMQESMFEIITSEATYLKSLNVLINVFLLSKAFGSDMSDQGVLTRQERHVVFSNIGTIRDASEQFLADLESRWQESVMISDVCDIIRKHASKNFECYVHYCSNQTFQDRAVTALKKKQDFLEALKRLESNPECQGLPMISFLLLPMQRITRLPLLVDAICHRMDPINDKDRHTSAIKALDALNRVVKRCNDGAKRMQQTEQMCLIAKQLDFRNKDMTQIPLISSSRYLVKQGELTRVMSDSGSRLPFGKAKAGKQAAYVFLFNDVLLITKKKGNQYVVTDYSMRNAIHVEALESPEKLAKHLPLGVPGGCKNLFLLVMLENYDKKMVECIFSCNSPSDRARWMEAVTPVKVSDDHERIYEEWDCPQVQCIKKYVPQEPDELALEESDVVNVFKKLEDGWYEGERMRDSERGWFPKENVSEIVNSHVRARNLRMKYRLMQVSEQNER